MALKRFQTSKRLWLIISGILFVVPWFISYDMKGGTFYNWYYWLMLVRSPGIESLLTWLYCVLYYGVPAVAFGWIIQCVVVIVRDYVREKYHHAA